MCKKGFWNSLSKGTGSSPVAETIYNNQIMEICHNAIVEEQGVLYARI